MPSAPTRQTPEELAAAHDYLCELWWVHLTPPARGLFAAEGHELTAVIAALIVCHEGMMREVMACVRRNGLHGAYRKAGTERVYQF